MAKYGKAASKRVESAMHRKKKGTLKSGSGRNDAAKRDLENVLSGFCLDCRSTGTNPSGSASGGSSAGAGSLGGGF